MSGENARRPSGEVHDDGPKESEKKTTDPTEAIAS
jgi:hypothetical protein